MILPAKTAKIKQELHKRVREPKNTARFSRKNLPENGLPLVMELAEPPGLGHDPIRTFR